LEAITAMSSFLDFANDFVFGVSVKIRSHGKADADSISSVQRQRQLPPARPGLFSDPLGRKATAEQMDGLCIKKGRFHGEWNYAISPRPSLWIGYNAKTDPEAAIRLGVVSRRLPGRRITL
jgi:hypothetical protein